MFNEPGEKEINLLPIVVHGAMCHEEKYKIVREAGLGICGMVSLCLEGEGLYTDSFGRKHSVKAGDIMFFTPETPHSYEPVIRPWKVIFILFSGSELVAICESLNLPPSGMFSPTQQLAEKANDYVHKILRAYESGAASRHITASTYLYMLLTLISKCGTSAVKNFENGFVKLVPAVQYIKNNYDNRDLTSDMIASHSGISHPHLCRLFAAVYGISPHDYLITTRVEQAKTILAEDKNIPVKAVAEMTGFSSPSYFTKVFKAKTGLTPAAFRSHGKYDF